MDPGALHPKSGHTPIHLACEANSLNAIVALLALGADPNQKYSKISRVDGRRTLDQTTALANVVSGEAAELLISAGAIVDEIDGEGFTPLAKAAIKRYPAVVEALLNGGADPSRKLSIDGSTITVAELIDHKIAVLKQTFGDDLNCAQQSYLHELAQIQELLNIKN